VSEHTEDTSGPSTQDSRRRAGLELARDLRSAAADRVPLPVRAVPWRAAVVALLIAAVFGAAVLARACTDSPTEIPARSQTTEGPPRQQAPPSVAAADGPSPTTPSTGPLVVDVAGRVRRPGLVRLSPGSRIWDAVTAAGGAGAGARLDRLNLARPVADGEQVLVPGPDDPVPSPETRAGAPVTAPSGGVTAGTPGSRVDLNAATQADLEALPGIGPVLAGRIIAWRDEHGRFTRPEDLGEVTGIGDKLLARLLPLVRA
jgi:competence protein ComEA